MEPLVCRPLPPGGAVGIVAPGSPYNTYSDVLRGVAWWEARGYRIKVANGALERTNWTAGSPQSRADDLMAMFGDPDVDVIECLRGGTNTAEVVPLLDYDFIADHPKAFIGFSDITALHVALQRNTGLATFYGPSLTVHAHASSFTNERMLQVLSGQTTGPVPRDPEDAFLRTLAPGKASGRLIGGCLGNLIQTIGTPWELNLDGAILFFEEIGASPHHIEAMLVHLKQAGKLDGIRGVVVVDLVDSEWSDGGGAPWPHTKTLEEVLQERLGALGVPVLYPIPVGHGSRLATLPLGVEATLDADTGTLIITQPALCEV
jgi:muramoyltetrapeptide carboxypeptidase